MDMKLIKKNNMENLLNEYYRTKQNQLRKNRPILPGQNILIFNRNKKNRFQINTVFTFGIVLMCGFFILTTGKQTEMAVIIEKALENTNVIEHIRSGSINMFEILSKSFM
jgi:hypothetical protein